MLLIFSVTIFFSSAKVGSRKKWSLAVQKNFMNFKKVFYLRLPFAFMIEVFAIYVACIERSAVCVLCGEGKSSMRRRPIFYVCCTSRAAAPSHYGGLVPTPQ